MDKDGDDPPRPRHYVAISIAYMIDPADQPSDTETLGHGITDVSVWVSMAHSSDNSLIEFGNYHQTG